MELIPESAEAIAQFGPFVIEDEDLTTELLDRADRVRGLVPQCVGLSVASSQDGLTFTVVASAQEIALLDALQYLDGGPSVGAVEAERVVGYQQAQLLDERQWQLFARGTAAAGVCSTLTLPILGEERVIGSVNLYAAAPTAFDGHHEAIARVFDAWAPGAVSNADLAFTTRLTAEAAPQILRHDIDVTVASGLIAREEDVSVEDGRRRLGEAAQRAGVGEAELAQVIIELRGLQDSE